MVFSNDDTRSFSSRLGLRNKKKETDSSKLKEKFRTLASFLRLNRRIKTRQNSSQHEAFPNLENIYNNAIGTSLDLGSGSGSSPALPVPGNGQLNVSPSNSGHVSSLENVYELEIQRMRFHGDIKSFSHELNSKGVRPFPLWEKTRGLYSLEEISSLIRTKFGKEKEEVNSELIAFAWDLVYLLESRHELQLEIEDLLLLARKCVETSPREFWRQCEDIVQDLDNRRQALSAGVLKQLHTRMIFILTRCTRVRQFYKENWEQEVVQLRQSRVLHYDTKVEPPKVVAAKPPKCPVKLSHEERSIICRICEEEICITYVEDHSRICALADIYDKKGVSVDERLVAVSVTLDKIIEKFIQKDSLVAVERPDGNASLAEESDVLSPKLSDWQQKMSEDDDDLGCITSALFKMCRGPKSDQDMTSSSGNMTFRPDLSEFLLEGKGAFHEKVNIPQMRKLADIAVCAANIIPDGDDSTKLLLSYIRDVMEIIEGTKFNSLIVEIFGTRIEKFIRRKYLQLCDIVDDEKFDLSGTLIDEDAPLEDGVTHCLRTSRVYPWDRTCISDFEILDQISKGAFGKVYLARKRRTGDIFAIKVLKKADMIRKKAVESILAERDILINAANPFVVRFYYAFTSTENLFLVMEYLNGGDFYSLLKNFGRLDESIVRVYVAEIVLALEYLHGKGVVHRDLKPDNLLIARDGHVKLADFGLSKVGLINSTDDLSGPDLNRTSDHELESVVGTPDYLAPEIILRTGQGTTVDWWSVGIILFELIVGMPPFNDVHPQKVFENICNRNIPWPCVPGEMSHEAHDLIDKLLTEDPRERLGARGAAEVKQHIFFKDINWDTLAEQKAVFVPDTALDTSYFQNRYTSHISDKKCMQSSDCDSLSDRQNEEIDEITECDISRDHSFSTFSLKNICELEFLTRDAMSKV